MKPNRTLTRILAPALLLTVALSLPAASAADPGKGRGQQVENAEKQKKQKQNKAKKNQKAKAAQPRQVRAAQPQRVVVREVQAPREVYTQRRYTQPSYRAGRSVSSYRQAAAGENSPLFAVDGVLTDEGRRCLALRDHRGKLYTLVGRTDGLQIGDHVSLMVRRVLPVYARECSQGDTVRVGQVRTIWEDRSHRNAAFDSRQDGDFNPYDRERYGNRRERYNRYRGSYDDRAPRDDERYDRRYDDDYDDRYDDRDDRGDRYGRVISVTGRLGGERDCPTLRDANGALFGLSGDLRDFGPGDRVRVIGFEEGRSRCGGRGIEVQEITGR